MKYRTVNAGAPLEEPSKECRLRIKYSQTSSSKHQHGLWKGIKKIK